MYKECVVVQVDSERSETEKSYKRDNSQLFHKGLIFSRTSEVPGTWFMTAVLSSMGFFHLSGLLACVNKMLLSN